MADKQIQKFGWRRDHLDIRDKFLTLTRSKVPLPASIDLRNGFMPPIYDQGDLGACTANAVAAAIDYERAVQGEDFITPSRLFIYYNERKIEGTVSSDSGAEIRDGIKSIASQGVCPESDWPYDITKFTIEPPAGDYSIALNNKTLRYSRVSQIDYYAKHCLGILKKPFVFGFAVYDDFQSDLVAKTGMVPMPQPNSSPIGGHAVLACGYDDTKKCFLVRNSWGIDWGLKGYFWLPYAYMLNTRFADDFWVLMLEA